MRYFTVRYRDSLGRIQEVFNASRGFMRGFMPAGGDTVTEQTHHYSATEIAAIRAAKAREERTRDHEGMADAFNALRRVGAARRREGAAMWESVVRRHINAMHSER